MKKSLFSLWLLAMLFYGLCVFPVFGLTPDRTYVTFSSTLLPDGLAAEACWHVGSGYVLRLDGADEARRFLVPRSQRVVTYDRENTHIVITGNPFLQGIPSASGSRLGSPYLID